MSDHFLMVRELTKPDTPLTFCKKSFKKTRKFEKVFVSLLKQKKKFFNLMK